MFSLRHGTFMKVFKNFGLLAGHCETVGAQIKMVSNNMFGTYTIYEIHKGYSAYSVAQWPGHK